jgi:Putative transposase of IS4/5 family (DUF4096)
VVVAVERSAAAILEWSNWRRWHQAWARYYHYRRHPQAATQPRAAPAASEGAQTAPPDVLELVWCRLEVMLPASKRMGRPYAHPRRSILEAIVYLMRSDCGWLHVPSQFPPWQTVYTQFRKWRKSGIWATIWAGLDQPHPTDELQL